MAKSRVQKANDAYLARCNKSIQVEQDVNRQKREERQMKQAIRTERERIISERQAARDARDKAITRINDDYGTFWCSTVTDTLPALIKVIKSGTDADTPQRAMRVHVFDRDTHTRTAYPVIDLLAMLEGPLQECQPTLGQAHWHGNILISYVVYEFVRKLWNEEDATYSEA